MASLSSLQGNTVFDKFCDADVSVSIEWSRDKVQCHTETHQGGREQPDLVELPRQKDPIAISINSQNTDYDNRIGCFQYGVGSSTRRATDRGEMVQRGSLTPYKLSGIVGSLPGSTMFCQTQPWCDHLDETGQCHSSDIHKKVGGNTLTPTLSACSNHMGLEHTEKHLPTGETSAREGQSSGRSGIKINEGSLRLDTESSGIQPNPAPDGATRDRLVCFPINKATTTILQLETRPRDSRDRCVQSGLVKNERTCQSPMVLDRTLPESSKETSSQNSDNHSIVDISTVVSIHPGDVGEFSKVITRERRLSDSPVRARIHNESGGTEISSMAHIRESFTSRGISTEATDLLLSSWRPKTKSNYNSLFAKWSCWCTERNRDPTMGPVEDIINFLAQLFKEGYQYWSLNSCRSATSAVHSKVDGQSVGQHPLVTRMLKGIYNEIPPLARYSTFWDVGVVLRYLRGLGENKALSLRLLTLKSAMSLALTRPARSVDLSKLDICFRARAFTSTGVTFKDQHLSKQSR